MVFCIPFSSLNAHGPTSQVNFITGLPPSQGNAVILTVIVRFFKSEHHIPLVMLPSVLETANHLFTNALKLHGLSLGIVSDHSLSPLFGGSFARWWLQQWDCSLVTTPTAIGKWRSTIIWRTHSAVLLVKTQPPGVCTFAGLNTRTTRSHA